MKYLVTRIQVPMTGVDDNVLWCVREGAMSFTTLCIKKKEGPFLPLLLPREILTSLRYLGDFDSDVYLEIKRRKNFDLTKERNHTTDRSYTNFRYVCALYNSHWSSHFVLNFT